MTDTANLSSEDLDRASPLVSIVIPYFRQEAYLSAAVESARQQTHRRTEIIVVDDGSPVSAASVLRSPIGVTLLRTENRGVAAARNLGFEASSGEFLVFLDSDDLLETIAIEAHLEAFRSHPSAGMSFGAVRFIDSAGRAVGGPYVCRAKRSYLRTFLCRNPIGCPGAVMIRRDVFTTSGGFDMLPFQVEDYLLYLKIVTAFEVVRHTRCVVAYRQHELSASADERAMRRGTLAALRCIEPRLALHHRLFVWFIRAARAASGRR